MKLPITHYSLISWSISFFLTTLTWLPDPHQWSLVPYLMSLICYNWPANSQPEYIPPLFFSRSAYRLLRGIKKSTFSCWFYDFLQQLVLKFLALMLLLSPISLGQLTILVMDDFFSYSYGKSKVIRSVLLTSLTYTLKMYLHLVLVLSFLHRERNVLIFQESFFICAFNLHLPCAASSENLLYQLQLGLEQHRGLGYQTQSKICM